MGRWSRRLAPLLLDFAQISGAVRVVDVGCGTGSVGACLARRPELLHVSGVDLSFAYVDHARRSQADARLSFVVADAAALPFPDACFDHAVSVLALQFMAHPDLAVAEMRRVTRPGGTVAAATWDARGGLVASRIVLDTAAVLEPGGNIARARACTKPMSRPGQLAEAWARAGLTGVVQASTTMRMEFVSFDDYWSPMEGTEGPIARYLGGLDRAVRCRLRTAVARAYLDGEVDGPRSYAATAWIVKGATPDRGAS